MADGPSILLKKKKINLPAGWVERFSKKHPDRPFYFNENTGERRWSPPVDPSDKVIDQKARKRKITDSENEDSPDTTTSAANKLLNAITSNRPKLKPKVSGEPENESKKDTPAMRLYREKLEQRKALQAQKNTPKKKLNQTIDGTKSNPTTSTPSIQRKSRRSSSVLSSNESIISNCSTISNASSMGSKIKAAASKKVGKPEAQIEVDKLPKISKVPLNRTKTANKEKDVSTNVNNNVEIQSPSEDEIPTTTAFTRRSISKTVANERLDNFRKSLGTPRKRSRLSESQNKNELLDESKLIDFEIPETYKTGKSRLNRVDSRIQNNHILEINQNRLLEQEEPKNKSILDKFEAADAYCEQMDWEPIEDEKITSEVYSVRYQLGERPAERLSDLSYNISMSMDMSGEKDALYVVVDTNVFLSNLPFIEEVRDSRSDRFGRPFIVIPWTVLQELDFIKDDKSNMRSHSLKLKARRAVDFLNQHFNAKHPRFLGQTPADVERNRRKFLTECPDDEILQTCLQIKEASKTPVLLSYDKNLCTKGMIHDVLIIGRNDPLEKMYYLKAADSTGFLSNSLHTHIEDNSDITIVQKELVEADDIMEEGKAILKLVLSQVVSTEMEALFGNRWEMHVVVRPPWTILTVLKCALKHWIAAVNESFTRKTESILRDILKCLTNAPEGGRKLEDVEHFLKMCKDVIITLNIEKHSGLKSQAETKIDDIIQRCTETEIQLNKEKFSESVGFVDENSEEAKRALAAFKVFDDLYSFARDVCGIASEALGLQCSFAYNRLHPFLTAKLSLELQKDVGVNVNRLSQMLRMALSRMSEGIQYNDRVIFALYEVMVNFGSELNFEELKNLTPLDLFCCLKLERKKLEKGYDQLQELAVHYCRMANYQCT